MYKQRKKESKSHYRAHIASICYPEIARNIGKVGFFEMPIIQPNYNIPTVVATTPFDKIGLRNANKESIVIFYINDDRFATKLTHPWTYTPKLLQYSAVIAPDLSQYTDMPYPMRIVNNYWNKVFTAYWQQQNVNIYPNVTWSLADSYEYSAAGLPRKSVIAINSIGALNNHFSAGLWLSGYQYMLKALDPICILRYGPKLYGEEESISIYLENKELEILRNGRKRK